MITSILVPVDGSPSCKNALSLARELADKHGAKVTLLHVIPLPTLELLAYRGPMGGTDILPQQVEERLRTDSDRILAEAQELVGAERLSQARAVLGHPSQLITETAEEEDFSLVIMGSRGFGRVGGFLMGSVSNYVVTHCKAPVLIVKGD